MDEKRALIEIEKLIIDKDFQKAVESSYKCGYKYLGDLIGIFSELPKSYMKSIQPLFVEHVKEEVVNNNVVNNNVVNNNVVNNVVNNNVIFISIHCNWCSSNDLLRLWNKMSQGNGNWGDIQLIENISEAKYHVVINSTIEDLDASKTIVFRMEPHMEKRRDIWGDWASLDKSKFLRVFDHKSHLQREIFECPYNNCEWHLNRNWKELKEIVINKDPSRYGIISTVLSSKYTDPGHKKRMDFAKFLDSKDDVPLHVYGTDVGYKNFKGSLPHYQKDDALFPYAYTFNVENHEIPNYFTEKFIDAILSETLIFYHGPKNIRDYFDERSFVWLDLEDFEADLLKIKTAITEDWRTLRLPYIRMEKKRILNELGFFPRLEKIIKKTEKKSRTLNIV